MLAKRLATSLPKVIKRNIGIAAPALQKASDPIQQLFLDKLHEYTSKSPDGKLFEPTPDIEKELKAERDKLATQYGGAGAAAMSQFPQFKFADPAVEVDAKK